MRRRVRDGGRSVRSSRKHGGGAEVKLIERTDTEACAGRSRKRSESREGRTEMRMTGLDIRERHMDWRMCHMTQGYVNKKRENDIIKKARERRNQESERTTESRKPVQKAKRAKKSAQPASTKLGGLCKNV